MLFTLVRDEHYSEYVRPDVFKLIPNGVRTVLDVGCAAGALGQLIKSQSDCVVVGVERDPQVAQIARTRLDEVIELDLENPALKSQLAGREFDCILFADVLEHLRDPWHILQQMAEHLAPGGTIVASLPNVRHYSTLWSLGVRAEWPHRSRGIHDWEHLRFFTLKTMHELFEGADLEVAQVERNYRLIERPHKINRFAKFIKRHPLSEFFVFQYLIVAKKNSNLPPKSLRPCGASFKADAYYLESALSDVKQLRAEGRLTRKSTVLDLGCGTGRIASALIQKFGTIEKYVGADVQPKLIEWCQANLSTKKPAFQFVHLNVQNDRYYPEGQKIEDGFRLPFEKESFSHVLLYSVLTHLPPADLMPHLSEIRRVMKRDGKAYCTCFVKDGAELAVINPEGYRTPSLGPLHRVQYNLKFLRECFHEARLEILSERPWIEEQTGFWLKRLENA